MQIYVQDHNTATVVKTEVGGLVGTLEDVCIGHHHGSGPHHGNVPYRDIGHHLAADHRHGIGRQWDNDHHHEICVRHADSRGQRKPRKHDCVVGCKHIQSIFELSDITQCIGTCALG